MIRQLLTAPVLPLQEAHSLVCVADSRDGVAIYRTFKKKEKTTMRLVAVTPFAEALNPMAVSLLRMNSTLWLFMFDT